MMDSSEFDLDLSPTEVDIFAPDLPSVTPPAAIIVQENEDFGHISLRKDNLPEDRLLSLPKLNLPKDTTEEQRKLVDSAVKDIILSGASSGAMLCRGDGDDEGKQCPYLKKCPLYRAKIPLPIGYDCPIETAAINTWLQGYLRELEVNPHDAASSFDAQSAVAMAGLQLQILRARWGEALNPLLEQEIESIMQNGPKTITNIVKVGNYNTDYREKAIKALNKMAKDNMQTRERKTVLMKSGFKDKSKHAAEVTERLTKLVAEVEEKIDLTPEGTVKSLSRIRRVHKGDDQDGELNPDSI